MEKPKRNLTMASLLALSTSHMRAGFEPADDGPRTNKTAASRKRRAATKRARKARRKNR